MNDIETDIDDIINTDFNYYITKTVPPSADPALSYERNKEKRGKVLTSCVLYVDIRNSVALTEKHTAKVMGKVYTAFTKGGIKAARYHGGHTRNIIGDRIMIVFPEVDCFTNAIKCEISINHVAQIINNKFKNVDFKCGIGIDYGKMRITKVGVPRKGQENQPNRGLVWAGVPANIASRLTDMGNKKIFRTMYELNLTPTLYDYLTRPTLTSYNPSSPSPKYRFDLKAANNSLPDPITISEEQFLAGISMRDGSLYYRFRKVISFTKKMIEYEYPAILFTERVYNGLMKEGEADLYHKDFWKVQNFSIRNVTGKVFGGSITWDL